MFWCTQGHPAIPDESCLPETPQLHHHETLKLISRQASGYAQKLLKCKRLQTLFSSYKKLFWKWLFFIPLVCTFPAFLPLSPHLFAVFLLDLNFLIVLLFFICGDEINNPLLLLPPPPQSPPPRWNEHFTRPETFNRLLLKKLIETSPLVTFCVST